MFSEKKIIMTNKDLLNSTYFRLDYINNISITNTKLNMNSLLQNLQEYDSWGEKTSGVKRQFSEGYKRFS